MKKRALFLCELADILLRSVSALVLSFAATLPAFLSIGKMGGVILKFPFLQRVRLEQFSLLQPCRVLVREIIWINDTKY